MEIDSVQRSLCSYFTPQTEHQLMESTRGQNAPRPRIERARQETRLEAGRTHGTAVAPQLGRRERVLAILRDKGEATIKDIMAFITDCSEKTIQRELITLIKDNIVQREGERRWSKYKLV